ncbi:MAG TPA: hypothetical protein VFE47_29235 [Tepidisphaeraceae bacterium]|jgi:hypothetical protein|nr:hypothetical protein [Tepidisphaeraceae bacterium]
MAINNLTQSPFAEEKAQSQQLKPAIGIQIVRQWTRLMLELRPMAVNREVGVLRPISGIDY